METCGICDQKFNKSNGLSFHIKKEHGITAQEYYDMQYGRGSCSVCGGETRFISIPKGYVDTCSPSCSAKKQWDNESRKDAQRQRFVDNNPGIPGARKGCRNKNPYPTNSPLVIERIKKTTEQLKEKDHWNRINADPEVRAKVKATWDSKSFEEITEILDKRHATFAANLESVGDTITGNNFNTLDQWFMEIKDGTS